MSTAVETLRDIETTLLALCEIDPEDLNPELRKEYERDLMEAIRKAPEKRERVAVKLFDLGQRAAVKRAAAQAHMQRAAELEASAKRYEADVDRLKNYVLDVMRELPQPKKGPRILEGTSATFKAAKVPDSVEVFDEAALPEIFRTVTVTLPIAHYKHLLSSKIDLAPYVTDWGRVEKKEIKAALSEPCPTCDHVRKAIVAHFGERGLETGAPCPSCGGAGTKRVPGARMVTGKLRLVVE